MSTITCPTRITQTSATLIDNVFVSAKLHRSFDSAILLSDMSDHLLSLVLLKQTKIFDKEPLEFESRNLNSKRMSEINDKLSTIDWNGILTSNDVNINFNILCDCINTAMDTVAPVKTMHISSKQRFVKPWMTPALKESARKK